MITGSHYHVTVQFLTLTVFLVLILALLSYSVWQNKLDSQISSYIMQLAIVSFPKQHSSLAQLCHVYLLLQILIYYKSQKVQYLQQVVQPGKWFDENVSTFIWKLVSSSSEEIQYFIKIKVIVTKIENKNIYRITEQLTNITLYKCVNMLWHLEYLHLQ